MLHPPLKVFPEDLIDLIIVADARRRQALGLAPSRFRPSQRLWIEPWFNVLGRLFGLLTLLLPLSLRRRLYLYFCQKVGGHPPENNPDLKTLTDQTVAMARALQAQTGQRPALFVLTSHPETMGPLEWLRFEILRQGLVIANAVSEAIGTPHPQCFLAIDPYALDTLSPAVGGFYAGWMHEIYIAWDRQASTQSWIQRKWLFRGTGYDQIAWRLLKRLRINPVLMVLSGGLPHNARMLYTAREFIQRLTFSRAGITKRMAEKRLMQILMEPVDGTRPAEKGDLPSPTVTKIKSFLAELGVADACMNDLLAEFAEEWRRSIPNRARLFNVLAQRLAARGTSLILLPITHQNTAPHIKIHAPRPFDPSSFARDFVN